MPVDFTKNDGRIGAGILAQIEASHLAAGLAVDDADEGIGHHAEVLAALIGLMDGHREGQLTHVGGDARQFDVDGFVIAVAGAGAVVAGMLDGAADRLEVVVEDEIAVATDLAGGVQEEAGGVKVEIVAIGAAGVPAQANHDGLNTRFFLGKRNIAAFDEGYRHGSAPVVRGSR